MENEIRNATSVNEINLILKSFAGQYDLDMLIITMAGIGCGVKKGIVETPLSERGSVKEYTGADVYSIDSTKDIKEIKEVVIKSIKYRQLFTILPPNV